MFINARHAMCGSIITRAGDDEGHTQNSPTPFPRPDVVGGD